MSSHKRRALRSVAVATIVPLLIAVAFATPAPAQDGPFPSQLVLTPESDAATSGTCNEFTARVTGGGEVPSPISGLMVDVTQALDTPGNEPEETRELSFCNPTNPSGANPTGVGGTAFGDVTGNNPGDTAGQPGRSTTVHGEVGPTDANGEVTFGISMLPAALGGQVLVSAWVDSFEEDDFRGEGEPDDTATKTWNADETPAVITIDAAPETATNPTGSQHQVTVTALSDGDPIEGLVPNSVVAADGTGRPPGDVANELAGPSPNDVPGKPKPNAYACTPSSAAGISTCTFQDPAATGPGTDTIVFYVNQAGGTLDPDQGEPQDAVQNTWQAPPPAGGGPPQTGPPAPQARNIQLCHGEETGAACDNAPASEDVAAEHLLSARVTDREGEPLEGIRVELRESGPAFFAGGDAHSVVVVTGAGGVARAVMSADEAGPSVVVAEISPTTLTGSFRGPLASDDECEQAAGPGGSPAAGNCLTSTTVSWEVQALPECEDGEDNDGDGFTDGDDPGCDDGTEEPYNGPPIERDHHDRRINMRFRDWVGPGDEGLAIFGRLRLSDDADDFRACTAGQPVEIQRLVDGDWVTKKFTTTNQKGRYAGVVFDLAAQYRAVAPRVAIFTDITSAVCRRAQKVKTHHHRR